MLALHLTVRLEVWYCTSPPTGTQEDKIIDFHLKYCGGVPLHSVYLVFLLAVPGNYSAVNGLPCCMKEAGIEPLS